MTDYGEEQRNELEALESIYPDSFTGDFGGWGGGRGRAALPPSRPSARALDSFPSALPAPFPTEIGRTGWPCEGPGAIPRALVSRNRSHPRFTEARGNKLSECAEFRQKRGGSFLFSFLFLRFYPLVEQQLVDMLSFESSALEFVSFV